MSAMGSCEINVYFYLNVLSKDFKASLIMVVVNLVNPESVIILKGTKML